MNENVNYEEAGLILTPEQLAILEGVNENEGSGDTDVKEENSKAEESTEAPAGGKSDESEKNTNKSEKEPEESEKVIQAKDGKHTIPYEKLTQARDAERAAKAEAEELRKQLEALKKSDTSKTEESKADDSDKSLFGDLSDEDLKKGVDKLVAERLKDYDATMKQQKAAEEHYRQIYSAHPDADSIVESKELKEWLDAQAPIIRKAFNDALSNGTTKDVIDAFDMFKSSTAKKDAAPEDDASKQKEQSHQPVVKKSIPNTLSDIPTGRDHSSSENPLDSLSGIALADKLANMPESEVEKFLNSPNSN